MRPTGVGPAQTWTINNHDAPVGLPLARKHARKVACARWAGWSGGKLKRQELKGADVLLLFSSCLLHRDRTRLCGRRVIERGEGTTIQRNDNDMAYGEKCKIKHR